MNENIIGEIFNEFKEYGHSSVINTEIFEQQINILQPEVIGCCIFSEDLAKFNNDTQEIELYHWYNIFQNNPTPDEVKASEDKTHKFLSSFNISTADSKGLSYDVTIWRSLHINGIRLSLSTLITKSSPPITWFMRYSWIMSFWPYFLSNSGNRIYNLF